MYLKQRQEEIMRILKENSFAEVDFLAEQLGVSTMTIRRDLQKLSEQGLVARQHGGAFLPEEMRGEKDYGVKKSTNVDIKKQIARKALELVKDGDTIFLDNGTTTYEIAALLHSRYNITVLTGDIQIATLLLKTDVRLVLVGGVVQNQTGCVVSGDARDFIRRFRVSKTFLAAPSIDKHWDVLTPTVDKAYYKQAAISIATETYLVADSSKFDGVSFSRICNLRDLSGVITDRIFTKQEQQELINKDVNIISVVSDEGSVVNK